jgi:hypothetical protein
MMAMKDVISLRYAPGRRLIAFDPEISEWGNPSALAETFSVTLARANPGK